MRQVDVVEWVIGPTLRDGEANSQQRRGVMMLRMGTWIKERGLLLANLVLFATFFVGMIISGVQVYNADQVKRLFTMEGVAMV